MPENRYQCDKINEARFKKTYPRIEMLNTRERKLKMYIKQLILTNFKGYVGEQIFEFSDKVNYFVGDNNSGKTTIFDAIHLLFSGESIEGYRNNTVQDVVAIEAELADVHAEKIPPKASKYAGLVSDDGRLIFRKSSSDPKKVFVWDFSAEAPEFINVTGAGNTITALFDPEPIYADLSNDSVQKFGTTGITGKLLNKVAEKFLDGPKWAGFVSAHSDAFEGGQGSLDDTTTDLKNQINSKIRDQFGEAEISFKFEVPSATDLIKNGLINVKEQNGVETPASEKGNGLQRALALAIIQVYADMYAYSETDETPFLVDEPELYMHPMAQDKLMKALQNLSATNQIFVTTHSPYILRNFRPEYDIVQILADNPKMRASKMADLVLPSPTIGEITYRAFGVPTVDLHQDLFTKIYIHWIERIYEESGNPTLVKFDAFLQERGLQTFPFTPRINGEWKPEKQTTLPYIVRNEIDHPETLDDGKNVWNDKNLKDSINLLLELYVELNIMKSDSEV